MAQYSIKDLEHLTGIKAHTIRIWEKRYGILRPERTDTNIRYYNDEDVRRLINISILNRNGFKISRISGLSEEEIRDKVVYLSMDMSETETQIESLVLAMINLDESRFSEILSKSSMAYGFESTFLNIMYPFLHRIGILWQTGAINPGQEHFISNLIRQKLIANIDAQLPVNKEESKRFILFLPEGELHEFGLLFLAFLVKKRGHELLYLGQFTPLESVIKTNEIWKADYIVTALVSNLSGVNPPAFAKELVEAFPEKKVLFTGELSKKADVGRFPNAQFFATSSEFIEWLDAKK